jgi:hypothetical protein
LATADVIRGENQKSSAKRDGTVFFPPLPAKIPSKTLISLNYELSAFS